MIRIGIFRFRGVVVGIFIGIVVGGGGFRFISGTWRIGYKEKIFGSCIYLLFSCKLVYFFEFFLYNILGVEKI